MRGLRLFLVVLVCFGFQSQAQSAVDKEAKWMLERITGVRWPANSPVLDQMAVFISNSQRDKAAELAMQQPQFLNITIKQLALQMSTRDESIRVALNDFATTFIGVVRDDADARTLLTGNFFYQADPARIPAGVTIPSSVANDILGSNNHYSSIESNNLDIGAVITRTEGQMLLLDRGAGTTGANPDPAGILTSRTFLEAHATAGTNRRLVEYAFREFTCTPLEKWSDTQAPDLRIGRDIDRYPGGDPVKFQTSCKGCHTVMDGFRGAFAKWDFTNGNSVHSGANVVRKMNQNSQVFGGGFTTTNDSWENYAVRGVNAETFGWRGPASAGSGVSQFGAVIANSQRFSSCMAKRVFQSVCQRQLGTEEAQLLFYSLGRSWEGQEYKFKKLVEIVATHPKCRGSEI